MLFYVPAAGRHYDVRTMPELTPYRANALPGDVAVSPQSARDLHELGRFWSALLRRRMLFLAIFFGFVAMVAVATLLTPKSYTTTVRLMPGTPARPQNLEGTTSLPILNALVLQNGEQSAETFAALAQQENVAEAVSKQLNLPLPPHELLSHVTVKPVVNTELLNLSVRWSTPEGSAQLANAFAEAFIESERNFVRSQASAALGFLSSEMPTAERKMHDAAQALANFQAANGFVDANTHTQDVVARSGAIDSQIAALLLDRREANALLANVQGQMGGVPATINNAKQISVNPVLTDLRTKLANAQLALQAARAQYTDKHPTVIALTKQRDDLQAQINALPPQIDSGDTFAPNPVYQSLQQQAVQYRARVEGDKAKLSQLYQQKSALAPVLRRLPSQGMQLADLQQRAKLTSDVYNALQQKYNDATIAKTTAISDISVVQPATAAAAVKSPRLAVNLAVAIAVGLLLASLIVFALDYFERTLRDSGDVQMSMGLPVIASIPMFTSSNPRALPWLQSLTIEAFLHLCVTLRLSKRRPLRSIAITSPSQGDGKSTIAYNLAKAMAKVQPRVLLIDADLRHSTLHELAGRKNDVGLTDVLQGGRGLSDAVHEIEPQLDLLSSGRDIGNPVALLQSARLDDVLRNAEEKYSIVIIDTPPVTYVPDGLSICSKVDGTALVVAANTTEERAARQIVVQFEALGIDNVLGVILNKDRARFHDYSDYFATSFRHALPGGQ